MYGASSAIATVMFLKSRAAQVTNDLFTHIATQHADSSLENEARIIIAELEGPNGPYFRKICEKNNFLLPYDMYDNPQFQNNNESTSVND